jgi:hypothetical protein
MTISRLAVVLGVLLIVATPLLAQDQPLKLSGPHYNLNLLGKDKCPGDDLKGTSRHTIMVLLNFSDASEPNSIVGDGDVLYADLDKRNKIFLAPGPYFQVTDGNACDKDGAAFTLPDSIASAWDIYVRELGKPGGTGSITTCGVAAGEDGVIGNQDDEVVCSSESVDLIRKAGRPVWKNVTKDLTTIDYQTLVGYDAVTNEPIYVDDTVALFDAAFYQYFWDYDNNGLRLVQMRFYPVPPPPLP